MNTVMGSYGKWNEWKDVSKYPMDTQDFFKKVQAELDVGKCKMEVITEMHGWPAIQDMYNKGTRSVDRCFCLGSPLLWRAKLPEDFVWKVVGSRQKIILQKLGGGGQRKDAGPN